MEELFTQAVYFAGILAPIITALIELIKRSGRFGEYLPYLSIIIGIVTGVIFGTYLGADLFVYGLSGLIAGLTASGLYDSIDLTNKKLKGED